MSSLAAGELSSALPEILLAGAGVAILLLGALLPRLGPRFLYPAASVAVIASAWLSWTRQAEGEPFGGLLESTPWTRGTGLIVCLAALLALLASSTYLSRLRVRGGEFPALLLWSTGAALILIRGTDLITIFLALELLSVASYSLAALVERSSLATESALKHFLVGAFASAFVLYGIALLYGRSGSTSLETIAATGLGGDLLALMGLLLLVAGVAFKLAVVPFHGWAPDAYQGAPTPFVAYLSVVPKVAAAVVLLRLLGVSRILEAGAGWSQALSLLSVASMVLGNLLALVQRDIKRMLAYSGIAHMGYLLIAMVTLGPDSYPAVFVYLLAYALMSAGAFSIVGLLYRRADEEHPIEELSGWGYRLPFLGFALSVCMLSLAGIPPTAGFLARYLVFLHALRHGHYALAITGAVTSLVGVAYCLRVVHVLYMKSEVVEPIELQIDPWGRLAAFFASFGTLLLGILPGRLLIWLRDVASMIS